ncbi:MAG TPA: SulP family inorganic anion transporter [Rhodocyclaceae bacterium]|nr:SulP family inorganic anion transporter [Rhodocyclaceae bacterium]
MSRSALLSVTVLGVAMSIPQIVALSLLAGMPVEAGVYLSLLPAIAAALVSGTATALSGPNTAASMVLFAAASAVAVPGSPDYLEYVAMVTLFAGLFQLLFAVGRVGNLFLSMPAPVVSGIVAGTGVLILGQQIGATLGVPTSGNGFVENLLQAVYYDRINWATAAVVAVAVLSGVLLRRHRPWAKYSLLAALVAGCAAAAVIDGLVGAERADLEYLGRLSVRPWLLTWPFAANLDWSEIVAALQAGFAVAVVGALQALVIAKTLALRQGAVLPANRDLLGQAVMNLLAPFVCGYAGATSFNRTYAHLESGATTRWHGVAVLAAAFLAILVFPALLAKTSLAAVTGVLILVGWSLATGLRFEDYRRPRAALELIAAVLLTVTAGVADAILGGVLVSIYLRSVAAAAPAAAHRSA